MLNEFKKNYNLHLITFSLNTNAKQLTIITKRSILDVAAVLDKKSILICASKVFIFRPRKLNTLANSYKNTSFSEILKRNM